MHRHTRVRTILALASTLVLLVAMSEPALAVERVRVKSNFYRPKRLGVPTGTRVVWKNVAGRSHTVTAYRGKWDKNTTLSPGERTAFKFTQTGVYKYRCLIPGHSTLVDGKCTGMCGKIRVG